MALKINCPFCGHTVRIRTSGRPSLLTVQAVVGCGNCGQLKADFVGQLTNIRRAVYVEAPEVNSWDRTEKELIQDGKITQKTNEERLKELKGDQGDLFSQQAKNQSLPPETMTPSERIARRASVATH